MSDWVEGRLSDSIESLDAGVSVNAEDRPHGAGEIGVLKTSAVSGGRFLPDQNKTVVDHEKRLVAEPVCRDSILVSRMNTPALVGESCYVQEAQPTLFLPDRLWQLKPKDRTKISMRWLSFILQSAAYRRYVEVHATGTSGSMKNLPKAKMLALPVQYPSQQEQSQIAQILDTLDTAIQETEAIIAKLKAVKQGLLHDLLTRGIDANGELRPPQSEAPGLYKMSALGWIPREWEASQLNKFVDPRRPIVYGILMPGYGWPGGVPVVKVKDIVDEKIRTDNLLLTSPQIDREYSRSKIQSDDLLFTIRGTVGRTAFVPRELNQANITQDTARLAINCAYARFVRAFLNTPVARRFIEINTLGVAVQGINLRDVRLIPIAKPPADEAIEISDRLDAAAERIDNESLNLNKLQLAKSGLMDDLLTGRVRVTPLLPAHAEESP